VCVFSVFSVFSVCVCVCVFSVFSVCVCVCRMSNVFKRFDLLTLLVLLHQTVYKTLFKIENENENVILV
jgi:hypothetical protein